MEYLDVTDTTILTHLDTQYMELTEEDCENNCNLLKVVWNLDLLIDHLWNFIKELQTIDPSLGNGEVICTYL